MAVSMGITTPARHAMPDVLLISGGGPYADAWHSFPVTSARIAHIIGALGLSIEITEDVESALAQPGASRLLVVNIGNPSVPRPPDLIEAARTGIEDHLASGGSLLGIHSSAILTTMPQWPTILGGTWVRGRSMHPPQSEATILLSSHPHPVTNGLTDFVIFDERYSYLQTQPDITVLYEHSYDDLRHPLVWARQTDRFRVVYDGLGHDTASYDADGHVELLRRSVLWLLGDLQ
jgi:type 1 glutamine amidotransferase